MVGVAQLVEHRVVVAEEFFAGSSPVAHQKNAKKYPRGNPRVFLWNVVSPAGLEPASSH